MALPFVLRTAYRNAEQCLNMTLRNLHDFESPYIAPALTACRHAITPHTINDRRLCKGTSSTSSTQSLLTSLRPPPTAWKKTLLQMSMGALVCSGETQPQSMAQS